MTDLYGQKRPLFEDRLAQENSAAVAAAVGAAAQTASNVPSAADENLVAAEKPAAATGTAPETVNADKTTAANAVKKEKKEMKEKKADKDKKQLLLRLSPRLWEELAGWAEDDFRSINGQIEYLLSECVHQRHKRNSQKYDD